MAIILEIKMTKKKNPDVYKFKKYASKLIHKSKNIH